MKTSVERNTDFISTDCKISNTIHEYEFKRPELEQ